MLGPIIPTNAPGEWVSLAGLQSLTKARSDRDDGSFVLFASFGERQRQIVHRGTEAECITRAQEIAAIVNRHCGVGIDVSEVEG